MFDKYIAFHKEKFPLATPKIQLAKFEEEYNEMCQEKDPVRYMEEWGDCMLVAISLLRWQDMDSEAFALLHSLYFKHDKVTQKKVIKYLNKACKKVKQREYYFEDGEYRRDK